MNCLLVGGEESSLVSSRKPSFPMRPDRLGVQGIGAPCGSAGRAEGEDAVAQADGGAVGFPRRDGCAQRRPPHDV